MNKNPDLDFFKSDNMAFSNLSVWCVLLILVRPVLFVKSLSGILRKLRKSVIFVCYLTHCRNGRGRVLMTSRY